jgi:uncharacterized protein (DUF1499 family)
LTRRSHSASLTRSFIERIGFICASPIEGFIVGPVSPAYASRILIALAAIAALLLLVSGPGTRFELWSYRIGFDLLRYGAWTGAAAAALALIALAFGRTRRGHVAALTLALIIGVVCLALTLEFRTRGGRVPRINDISTDFANPATAEEQKKGYPDLKPLELPVAPDAAYTRALAAAEAMRWEISKRDPKARTFEAVDTTVWFAFKDDISVKVSAAGAGSRIDMRSKSRVGRSDLGTNARRIRAYFERLK